MFKKNIIKLVIKIFIKFKIFLFDNYLISKTKSLKTKEAIISKKE